jgi:lactoylglutathione lyase
MRLVVEAEDYEDAVRFYRDVLGAAEELPPIRTPWGSLNSRLDAPGRPQVTVFEELARGEANGD